MSAMAETARAKAWRTTALYSVSGAKRDQLTMALESAYSARHPSAAAGCSGLSFSIIDPRRWISASSILRRQVDVSCGCQTARSGNACWTYSLIRAGRGNLVQRGDTCGFLVKLGVELGCGLSEESGKVILKTLASTDLLDDIRVRRNGRLQQLMQSLHVLDLIKKVSFSGFPSRKKALTDVHDSPSH